MCAARVNTSDDLGPEGSSRHATRRRRTKTKTKTKTITTHRETTMNPLERWGWVGRDAMEWDAIGTTSHSPRRKRRKLDEARTRTRRKSNEEDNRRTTSETEQQHTQTVKNKGVTNEPHRRGMDWRLQWARRRIANGPQARRMTRPLRADVDGASESTARTPTAATALAAR